MKSNVHAIPMTCVRFAYKDERIASMVFNDKTKRIIMVDDLPDNVMYVDWRLVSRALRKDGWRIVNKMRVSV